MRSTTSRLRPRWAVLAIAAVVGLVGAVGCGTGDTSSSRVVRLSFWSGYAGPVPTAMEAVVAEFNAANPDIRVDVNFMPWDVFFGKLLPAYGSAGGPDLAAFDSTHVAQYAKKGVLAPMDDWFAADPASDVLITAATEAVTYDGVKYAVPMTFSSLKLFYHRPMFEAAGLDPDRPPTTWDEWRDAMVKLTTDHDRDGTPEQYGMALPDHDAIPVWPILLWGHGGDVLEPDGSKSALTRPETVAAVRTWADLLHRKKVSPVGLAGAEAEQLFQIGDAAMTVAGPWLTAGLEGVDYDVAPVPSGPVRQATLGSTTSVALNAKASPEKKQAAHRFLSYWVSEQAQESWMKGSGYPSIRVDQNALADNPFVAEFAADVRIAQPLMPGVVEFDKLYNDVFEKAIRNIGDGDVTVEDGLAAAAARMDEILAGSP
ncbi:multiple sugar transport system substrate-binding protein [Saccharothrix ecbatanensis]|uniref:Multiple sugar transport system substrate-binding protein n=1 Tax=Saccharothrix ecbatanensis TaxID=1105145 RepID=A0A7W9HFY5_9PSEU|nr:ABC transporter substrate-binding protein [Saccharothrix ecbatanensis]MBB5801542.1 multiple sugar transport system substrate-binding protein [Saccharothrix ecbatanensis]